jgi:hypothetical protein
VFPVAARPGVRPKLERRSGGVRRRGPPTPTLTVLVRRREEAEARRSVTSRARWRQPHVAHGARRTPRHFSSTHSGRRRGGDAPTKAAVGEHGGDGGWRCEMRVSELPG